MNSDWKGVILFGTNKPLTWEINPMNLIARWSEVNARNYADLIRVPLNYMDFNSWPKNSELRGPLYVN